MGDDFNLENGQLIHQAEDVGIANHGDGKTHLRATTAVLHRVMVRHLRIQGQDVCPVAVIYVEEWAVIQTSIPFGKMCQAMAHQDLLILRTNHQCLY